MLGCRPPWCGASSARITGARSAGNGRIHSAKLTRRSVAKVTVAATVSSARVFSFQALLTPARRPALSSQLPLLPLIAPLAHRSPSMAARHVSHSNGKAASSSSSASSDDEGHDHGHKPGHDHSHSHSHSNSMFGGHSHSREDGPSQDVESIVKALQGKGDAGSRITLIGLVVNVGLTASKGAAGWYMNSAALLAEAGHSASGSCLAEFAKVNK